VAVDILPAKPLILTLWHPANIGTVILSPDDEICLAKVADDLVSPLLVSEKWVGARKSR
jgi:hypothetical protein